MLGGPGLFQNKVLLCCTLYQWFLHIVAVGGLCMLTKECSKGGELFVLVTGHLSNSSPNHHHTHQGVTPCTHPTNIQTKKQPSSAIVCLCSLRQTNAFCSHHMVRDLP